MAWTESRVELLRKLWAEGLSGRQIAEQLGGTTRNAVIGKVHRLGLPRRAEPTRRMRSIPRQPRVRATPSAPRNMHVTRIKPIPAPVAKPNTFDDTPASRAAMALLGNAYDADKRREMFWGAR